MSHIENYIQKNRQLFDNEKPPAGHKERFLNKMPSKKTKTLAYTRHIAVAAAIAFLVTLSALYIYDNWIVETKQNLPTLADAGPSYAEAEAHFVSTIEHQNQAIERLTTEDMKSEKQQIEKDLKEMDSLYTQLQKDLDTNPDDPRVISAMVKHYRMRIKIMEQIVTQLQEVNRIKTNKTQNHEKVSL